MKVTGITAAPLLMRSANQPMTFFVVRVTTDEGLTGHGEACDCFGVSHPTVLAAIVDDVFAPALVGTEVGAGGPAVDAVLHATRRTLGAGTVAAQARSAVAIALTDLAAQAAGRSVSEAAGRVRDSVRVYVGSSPFLESGPATAHLDRLAPALDRGVDMVKMRIGPDWRGALRVLTELRGLLGDGVEVAVDASEFFTLADALGIADGLADLDIAWLEEPLPYEQRAAIAELARRTRVPLAYGEHLFTLGDAAEALAGGVTVVQPDAAITGGIEPARAVAALAAAQGVRAVGHHHGGVVSMAANLHVAASSAGLDVLEFPVHLDPLLSDDAGLDLGLSAIVDGRLPVPTGPGLGVGLAADFLERNALRA
ncbi:mandelate racemase/muconate lactonizing enzyme family protein [Modestobacter versicolor]|uniref:mandelate racemase/muconate lactonizing enzyme family protein n=1 Tax=Modestobacter versicolor TaxID=429133 RepID=UPI0034DE1D4E